MPLIDHPGSVLAVSIIQLISFPAGKSSLTLSPVAVPSLPLLRLRVKPICEPALTLTASDVFVMVTSGVGIGVTVGVGVGIGVGVGVGVGIGVGVGVAVGVGVGVAAALTKG